MYRSAHPPRIAQACRACCLLALLPGLAAHAQSGAAAPAGGQQASATPTAFADAVPRDRIINMVLVKVNGDPILLSDLQELENDRIELLRQSVPEAQLQAQLPLLRRQLLIGLIDEKMMLQRADLLGITADANMVDSQIRRIRESQNLTDDAEFEAALAQLGLTVDELREQVRKTLRQQLLVQQEVNRGVFVSEQEIARYYSEHADEFQAPERVRLRQLIFLVQGREPAEIRRQAEAALAELRAGAPYESVADKYTNAIAAGGEETFVAVDELNAALAQVVPGLPVDVYSDVVQSQFGFHIVKVLERQDRQVAPLEQVHDSIRNRLTAEKSQKAMEEYLAGLRRRTKVDILAPEFADIEEAWRRAGEATRSEGEAGEQQ